MIEVSRKRNEALYKENDELMKILAAQEQEHAAMNELFNKFAESETRFKKLQEDNKVLGEKNARLTADEADKNSRVQEYKVRQEEARVEYEQVSALVEAQAYTKAGIAKIAAELAAIEESVRRVQEMAKAEDGQSIEKRQQRKALEEEVGKAVKKLNEEMAKVYGNEITQVKFEPEGNLVEEMLSISNGIPLEALEQNLSAVFKNKKEELTEKDLAFDKLKEEIRQKTKEAEDLKKSNELIKADIRDRRTRLKEIIKKEDYAELYFLNETDDYETMLRRTVKAIVGLEKELAALEEEKKNRKNYYEALIAQRKKDKEEIKGLLNEYVDTMYMYMVKTTNDIDESHNLIHNISIQVQQAEGFECYELPI